MNTETASEFLNIIHGDLGDGWGPWIDCPDSMLELLTVFKKTKEPVSVEMQQFAGNIVEVEYFFDTPYVDYMVKVLYNSYKEYEDNAVPMHATMKQKFK